MKKQQAIPDNTDMIMDHPACMRKISQLIMVMKREVVPLTTALGRVTATDLTALLPQPAFRQSLRDGYLVASGIGEAGSDQIFPITGIIQAGNVTETVILPGQAIRIMTGAMVPKAGNRVIPQEECSKDNDMVRIPAHALGNLRTHIEEEGSEMAVGDLVVAAGTVLQPEHIGLLATTGLNEIEVFRRPRVGFFCTGSELVEIGSVPLPGQKISSNQHLLAGLVRRFGGEPRFLGTIHDTHAALAQTFAELRATECDLVISTGGMGPGKYDLIEQAFLEAGGEVIYNHLDLTPGKNSLCGLLGEKLFFGLPGPPTAVHALMNAVVGPALLQIQGVGTLYPMIISACLSQPITIRRPGIMQLRGGILSYSDGRCLVRMAGKHEPPSCYMVIAADRSSYKQDELIEVQLTATPFGPHFS
ncbi:molybdopterin molybdotransferase MoeA [Desulfopila aestuarii]|uniref:molybdopterin molybdotransferase MoeA n=1 Tax=Desulfopila aestuarii TaxID=231440 RepID=UPI0009371B31|nr:molybdopterin molybdotransferase MoeA [Desulfopila aestuarii]